MRVLLACLAVAACVTTAEHTPPERVAGCWINRYAAVGPQTMQWTADEAQPMRMQGVRRSSRSVDTFVLSAAEAGWRLCENRADAEPRCWDVAEGEHGSLEGGRAFIDLIGNELRIAILGDGPERVIFQGRRQRCS